MLGVWGNIWYLVFFFQFCFGNFWEKRSYLFVAPIESNGTWYIVGRYKWVRFLIHIYTHIYVCVCVCVRVLSHFGHVWFFTTLWTVAHQVPLHGKNTGVDCHALLQGIFPTQVLNPMSFTSLALAGEFFPNSATWEALYIKIHVFIHCSLTNSS